MRLVGRDAECSRIEQLLDGARSGASGVLVLGGDAGIGKTALCDFAVEHAGGFRVLQQRSFPGESGLAFAGLADLVAPVLDVIPRLPAPQAAALAGAFAIGPEVGTDRFTVCAATLSLLAAVAEEQPLLVVLDNAQWLDASSVDALMFAGRRLEAESVAVIAAARGVDARRLGGSFERIRIHGLDTDATLELLSDLTECRPAPEVVAVLHEGTAGNPLALRDVAALLDPAQLEGREPLPTPLPLGATVGRALLEQIESLPDDDRLTLVVTAAEDGHADIDVILSACERLGGTGAFDQAALAGLVVQNGETISLPHPLTREVLLQSATPARLRAVHRSLAEGASGERAVERRARHLAASTDVPDAAVAEGIEEAARRAGSRGGHAEAARAFERAAGLTPDGEERARRLVAAADEARRAGRLDHAVESLAEALATTADPLLRARIQHLHAGLETWLGAPMTAHAILVEEAARVEAVDGERAALMLTDAAWASYMAGEIAVGLATARSAVALAHLAGPHASTLASVVLAEGLVLTGDATEGRNVLAAAHATLLESSRSSRGAQVVQAAGQIFTWLEDYGAARELIGAVVGTGRSKGSGGTLQYALGSLSELDFRTGAWTAAYAGAAEALRLAEEMGQASGVGFSLVCLARIEAARGRTAECRDHAYRALELAALGVRFVTVHASAALGLLELGHANHAAALEHLEPVARVVVRSGARGTGIVQWEPDLIEAYVRLGRRDDALLTLARFRERARETDNGWALAAAARCEGMLAEDDDGEAAFGRAYVQHDRTPTPFERARTELCHGERLRRARRPGDARVRLRAALETFERLGALPWVERAESELRASGETIAPRSAPTSLELTPQELQIATHVASGATNKETGAALYLSPKTVEAHLGRVYRKLGVRSRTELANLLAGEATSSASP